MAQNQSFSLSDIQGFGEQEAKPTSTPTPAPSSAAPAGPSSSFSFGDIDHDATNAANVAAKNAETANLGPDQPLNINGETIDPSDPDYMVLKRAQQIHDNLPPMLMGMAKATGRDVLSLLNFVTGSYLTPKGVPNLFDPNHIPAPTGRNEDIGEGLETALATYFGEGVAKDVLSGARLYDLASKYPKLQEVLSVAEKSPFLQKIIARSLQTGTVGGVIGGIKGAPSGQGIKGAAIGTGVGTGAGAVGGAAEAAGPAIASRIPTWMNPFRVAKAAEYAAPEAEAAVRSGVRSAAESTVGGPLTQSAAGDIAAAPIVRGPETIFDDTMDNIQGQERSAYNKLDKTVGFDYKAETDQLANDQYKLKQLGNTPADQTQRKALMDAINDSKTRLADADTKLQAAGINPGEARGLHMKRMAGVDIKNAVVRATGTDGNVDADKLLKNLQPLRLSKRGDRLAQFLGSPQAADDFQAALQKARTSGIGTKIKADAFRKILLGVGAIGATTAIGAETYSLIHH